MKRGVLIVGLALALAACKGNEKSPAAEAGKQAAASDDAKPAQSTPSEPASSETKTTSEKLFVYLPGDATSVSYDRLSQRLDPAVVEVVYALPPKGADLLDERELLDEGLDIVLDGDAEPGNWLTSTSVGFTLPIAKTPYFLRPLSKPAAELGPLLEQSFHETEAEGAKVWLPSGSFPWRIALLDGDVAAFIPVDIPGTGLAPLLEATKLEHSELEDKLGGVLQQDQTLELVLISRQPSVHFDVDQPIGEVQFSLRREGDGYAGQVVLAPTGDVDECVKQLRARKHPEENQQVQKLLESVEFLHEQGVVIGRLALDSNQLKHFLDL